MSNTKSRKLLSLILALVMLMGTLVIPAYADGADGDEEQGNKGDMVKDDFAAILNTVTYQQYLDANITAKHPDEVIKVDLSDFEVEGGNAEEYKYHSKDTCDADCLADHSGQGTCIETGETGRVTFNINVPEAGLYNLRMKYLPAKSTSTTNIERILRINGDVPYSEARNLAMQKKWKDEYAGKKREDKFEVDLNGNELRPDKTIVYEWQEYVLTDSNGYYTAPLCVYLDKGENTVSLEAVRHAAYFADIEFFKAETLPTYESVMKEYAAKGYKNASKNQVIEIDAETPVATSSNQIFATNDSVSSATDPQSHDKTLRNIISTSAVGQWVEYEVPVEESGIYSLVLRFRQNSSSSPVSRKLYVDGEVLYDAMETVRFGYSDNWQTGKMMSGDNEIKVYLEKGVHKIRLEVNLGEIGEVLRRATAIQKALSADYLEILRLTGADPEEYRDYGFSRVMPDTMKDLFNQGNELKAIVKYLEEEGQLSESTASLTQIAERVYTMGKDETQVAKNIANLQNDLSTLSSWISGMLTQPLEIDYIYVQSPDAEIPDAEENFFLGTWFEIKKFVASFYVDYNSLGSTVNGDVTGTPVVVWTVQSRDHTQIIKDQVDSNFTTQTKIPVELKLVVGGTLLPSILAGIGPDVSLEGMTSTGSAILTATGSIIDYAIRGAIEPLEGYEGFNDVKLRYVTDTRQATAGFDLDSYIPEQFVPVTLYDAEDPDVTHIYGLPVSFDWSMMFYRKDVFAALGYTEDQIPETWDEIMAVVPVLQFNNMDVGLGHGVTDFAGFVFQRGGEFWADDGMRVNFESNTTLEAFEYMANMFTQYSLPLTYDALTRFKTGELPLFLGSYITYNTIQIYAPEISGLWGFSAMPGTDTGAKDAEGNRILDNTVVGSADSIFMVKDSKNKDRAWEFMKWYTDKDFQVALSEELILLLGQSGMRTVANISAIEELPWNKDDLDALIAQIDSVKCLPQYPGTYIITRYVNFAVNNAYNEGADPIEQLLGYTSAINKEISRKRSEFGFETLAVGQTLAEKRIEQAVEELNGINNEKQKKLISEVKKTLEGSGVNMETVEEVIGKLQSSDSKLFANAIKYLKQAAEAFATYDN
ncbi:MAG: extracellular solute-binding protein [Clostridia bacterium]|nr:extracellular solute-binding protein [Clostridia bacterium]